MFTGLFSFPGHVDYEVNVTLGDTGGLGDVFSEVDPWQGSARIRVYGTLGGAFKGKIRAANQAGDLVIFQDADNWVRPVTIADEEEWQVRFTNLTGDTAQLGGNANDTWVSLTTNTFADLTLNDPVDPSVQYTVIGDLELRIGTDGPAEFISGMSLATETDEKKAHGQ